MNKKYKLNHFNFRKLNNNYLITNDFGNHSMLNEKEFNKLIKCEKLHKKLDELGGYGYRNLGKIINI